MAKKQRHTVKIPPTPDDTIAEKIRKTDGLVVHERIHPSKGVYADAPGDWGELTGDLKATMKTVGDRQPFFQAVKVVDREGCCKVFGTLAWKQGGEIYTLPIVCGGSGKGALPGMVCGTGNVDPLAINKNKLIKPYRMTGMYVHEGWKCKVGGLSVPAGTERSEFLMHPVRLANGTSHGCPCTPPAFAKTYETFFEKHGGCSFQLLPSTSVGGLQYNVKLQKEKMKTLADAYHAEKPEAKPEAEAIARAAQMAEESRRLVSTRGR